MKKLKVFQLTLVALFIIFLFFILRPVDYTKEYTIDDILISESYHKEGDYYYFTFTYNDYTLDYLYESNYKQKRTLVDQIEVITDENNFCLIPVGDDVEFIPLCQEKNEMIYYKKVSSELLNQIPDEFLKETKELNDTYESINIYNRDYTYLLWNYKGFYYINAQTEKQIDLFTSEIYNTPLIGYTTDYLIIADYDQSYTFDKFYRLSFKDGSVKEYNLDYDIYFDSYFPGYEKNKLYIIDNNEELMYEFNAKNGDLEKTKAKMLINDEWENVGIKSLINQNKQFTYPSNYVYELSEETLYLAYANSDIKMKIDEEVTSIIRIKDNLIFYLKTDTLYVYNLQKGSIRLLDYFEWNFNHENMIYVD